MRDPVIYHLFRFLRFLVFGSGDLISVYISARPRRRLRRGLKISEANATTFEADIITLELDIATLSSSYIDLCRFEVTSLWPFCLVTFVRFGRA